MSDWRGLEEESPEIAQAATELFARFELVVLGTVRADGLARLSLVEPRVIDHELFFGTTSDDGKTADLRAQPRCTIHSLVTHRTHEHPVFKATLYAAEVAPASLEHFAALLRRPEINWAPPPSSAAESSVPV